MTELKDIASNKTTARPGTAPSSGKRNHQSEQDQARRTINQAMRALQLSGTPPKVLERTRGPTSPHSRNSSVDSDKSLSPSPRPANGHSRRNSRAEADFDSDISDDDSEKVTPELVHRQKPPPRKHPVVPTLALPSKKQEMLEIVLYFTPFYPNTTLVSRSI